MMVSDDVEAARKAAIELRRDGRIRLSEPPDFRRCH
jgi:hypothetical protein